MNSIKDAYKQILGTYVAHQQGARDAVEDFWVEKYMRENPGFGREQALAAFRGRRETPSNPVKAPNPNSAAFKSGGMYDVNSLANKWG